ncbi:uncharacterized protein [Diadema antillarum]|uniref:uncharacterized protein n=1 Tax=Diadema antillarum TaxID=105358 RepID=UPI003A841976
MINIVTSSSYCDDMLTAIEDEEPDLINAVMSFARLNASDICAGVSSAFTTGTDWSINFPSTFSESFSWSSWWSSYGDSEWKFIDDLAFAAPLDIWIQIIGRIYQADSFRDGFLVLCDTVPEVFFDETGTSMCEAVQNEEYLSFLRLCYDATGEDDWDDWDDWGDWDAYMEEIFFDGIPEAVAGSVGLDTEGPYELCASAANLTNLDTDGLHNKVRDMIAGLVYYGGGWLYSSACWQYADWRHIWPTSWSSSWSSSPSYSWDISSSYWNYQLPEKSSLENALSQIYQHLGGYNNEQEMCTDMIFLGVDESMEEELITKLESVTDEIIKLTNTKSDCRAFVNHLVDNVLAEPLEAYTGYSTTNALCNFLYDTFSADDIDVDPISLPDFSSYSERDDLWQYIAEQAGAESGMIAPLVSFSTATKLAAKMYNADSLISAATIWCDAMSEYVIRVSGSGRKMEAICNAFTSDMEGVEWVEHCEEGMVPAFYGPDYPSSLRPFDDEEMISHVLDVLGLDLDIEDFEDPDPEGICRAVGSTVKDILTSGMSVLEYPKLLFVEIMEYILDKYGLDFCSEIDQVRDFLDSMEWWWEYGQDISWSSLPEEYAETADAPQFITTDTLDILDSIFGVLTGEGSLTRICQGMVNAAEDDAVDEWLETMYESMVEILENVNRCEKTIDVIIDIAGDDIDVDEIFEFIGFDGKQELCTELVQAVTNEVVEECKGIIDCAGECNGDAEEDCAGVCLGDAEYDCAGECGGSAYINYCFECVGGRTYRDDDFGADRCGNCRKAPDYVEVWDCSGSCNATAFYDRCGECVGGDSGLAEDHNDDRLDCRGLCDGDWVEDTCGFCEPYSDVSYTGGSKYKDCSSTCVTPGFPRADENECGECYGGSTGRDEDYGKNVCDQCESDPEADETSCEGCDGVANSGLEYDACGTCGGDGSDCVGVLSITPNIVPDKATQIYVRGAGFSSGSTLACVFINSISNEVEEDIDDRISYFELTCTTPALSPGEYQLAIRRNSDALSEFVQNIYVYEDFSYTSVSPTEALVNGSLIPITFEITAPSGAFADVRSLSDYNVKPSLLIYPEDSDEVYVNVGSFGSNSDFSVDFILPLHSDRALGYPSINGETPLLGGGVNLTAYWGAPILESAKFSSTGAALWLEFDSPVDYEDFESCDDVFDSVTGLGNDPWCLWRGPMSLAVVFGTGSGLLGIGDTLTLKDDAVYAFKQKYSYAASGSVSIAAPDSALVPEAILTGSASIPSCGDVELSGRRSTGSGARDMIYTWSVSSSGNVGSNLTDALDTINALNSGYGEPEIVVNGELLTASDTEYVFTLEVENFLGQSDQASFGVTRSATLAPEVTIKPRGVDINYVKVADKFDLVADIKFYSECVPAGETLIEWSVNNTNVALNLFTMYTRSLRVESGTLPGGEFIMFTVRVYKSSSPNDVTETSIIVTTHQSDLIAVIDGAKEFIVGRDSGTVSIDGSNSIDPDEQARPWTYVWLCEQITDNSACWSYDPDLLGTLIVNETNSGDSGLVFDAQALQADKTYEFTLVVRKETRTAQTTITIMAVNGDPPKVILTMDDEDGVINDDASVEFVAFIYHSSDLSTVNWATVDTVSGYGYLDLTDSSNLLADAQVLDGGDGFSVATITIAGDVVERGTNYAISLNVTDVDGQYSTVKTFITVRSGPTSCIFSVPNYEELNEVTFTTENCVTSADAYPLNYQLFVVGEDGNYEAISEQNSEPSFSGIGKPKLDDSDIRVYIIKVCDKNDMCSSWIAGTNVTVKESFSASDITNFKANYVSALSFAGNHLTALLNNNMLVTKVSGGSSRRRRTASASTDTTTAEQLTLIQNVLQNTVLDVSGAQILIDQLPAIDASLMTLSDQNTFLTYITQIVNVFINEDVAISETSAEIVLSQLEVIGEGLTAADNEAMLSKISNIVNKLGNSLRGGLTLGAPRQELSSGDVTVGVLRSLLTGTFSSTESGAGAVSIDFGSELSALFGNAWTCATGETCSGVTITFSHYATTYDPFSVDADDVSNRAADIISIELSNPSTGSAINVTGLSTPVTLTFPLSVSLTGVTYDCVYWDSSASDWSTSGISTTEVDGSTMQCQSTHLTDFTVMGTPIPSTEPSSTADPNSEIEALTNLVLYIAIGCAAGFVVLILVVVVLICVVLKMGNNAKANSNNAPTENVESPRHDPLPPRQPLPQPTMMDPVHPAYVSPHFDPPPQYEQTNPYNSMPPPPPISGPLAPPPVALVSGNQLSHAPLDTSANPMPSMEKKSKAAPDNSYTNYMDAVTGRRPLSGGMPGVEGVANYTEPSRPASRGTLSAGHM